MKTPDAPLLRTAYRLLSAAYGPQHWWPADTPFEMMAGAILTQNTSWSNVERALANFPGGVSPALVDLLTLEQLCVLVRPSGFYRQKAERLKRLAAWFKRYGCEAGRLRERPPEALRGELLALSGVGRETADSILLYAAGLPVFVVDAYTRRILSRLGCALPPDYEGLRAVLESSLPRDPALFNEYHALLVRHAKTHCKKSPQCGGCPLLGLCETGRSAQGAPETRT